VKALEKSGAFAVSNSLTLNKAILNWQFFY
jgi:hypothetical protein